MNIRDHPFLYQWDTNRYLDIPEADAVYVDFARTGEEPLRIAVADGGVRIPDSWLQAAGNKNIYVCYVDGTLRGYTLRIVPRPKPPDYVATPDEALSYKELAEGFREDVLRVEQEFLKVTPIILTQAEYNALLAEGKIDDDRVYFIRREGQT
nr:MAG TPA: hypothetical protein [Caudoviricetes sp.]